MPDLDALKDIKAANRGQFVSDPDVNSFHIDPRGEKFIIYIEPGSSPGLPSSIEGVPVEVREGGATLEDAADDIGRREAFRPAPLGVEIGNADKVGVGTLGLLLEDGDGNVYPASNAHVLGDFENPGETYGDEILQPGGGQTVGQRQFIQYGPTVDVSYFEPENGRFFNWLYGLEAPPQGEIYEPEPGDEILLVGRTSGVQRGIVETTSDDIYLSAGTVEDCITTEEHISAGGDSGSMWVHEEEPGVFRPVGLHFAGGGSGSICCKLSNVEEETGLSVVTGDRLVDYTDEMRDAPGAVEPLEGTRSRQNSLRVDGDTTFSLAATGLVSESPVGQPFDGSQSPPIQNPDLDSIGNHLYYSGGIAAFYYDGDEPVVHSNGVEIGLPQNSERRDYDHPTRVLPPAWATAAGAVVLVLLFASVAD